MKIHTGGKTSKETNFAFKIRVIAMRSAAARVTTGVTTGRIATASTR